MKKQYAKEILEFLCSESRKKTCATYGDLLTYFDNKREELSQILDLIGYNTSHLNINADIFYNTPSNGGGFGPSIKSSDRIDTDAVIKYLQFLDMLEDDGEIKSFTNF